MDDVTRPPEPPAITRRRLLQALAAIGITGPLAAELVAQSSARVSVDSLVQASAVLGEQFSAERIAVIEKALQRNLDQFQVVRDLVIDDLVEPAPIFTARAHAGPVTSAGRSK
ncbi:MAG: hypothetical protein ABR606_13620 [Vicinamibacterales bacterium]